MAAIKIAGMTSSASTCSQPPQEEGQEQDPEGGAEHAQNRKPSATMPWLRSSCTKSVLEDAVTLDQV